MIRKIGRCVQGCSMLFFFLIIIGVSSVVFYFWNSGLASGHHVAIVYETSVWLEELQKNNYIEKIEYNIKHGKVRTAYHDFDRLDRKVRDINRVKNIDRYYDVFRKDMSAVMGSIDKLVSFPEVSKIYQVLIEKLSKFDKFVTHNNWRTLSRTSSRILAKLNNLTSYSFPKIANVNRIIFQDITIMKSVTDSSVLPESDKNIISERLKILRTEVLMLEEYIVALRAFLENSQGLKKSYQNWVKRVAPEISLEKASLSQKSRNFSFLLMGLLAFTISLFFVSLLIFRKRSLRAHDLIEEYALDLIKNKLLTTDFAFNDESLEFQKEFRKNHQYLHKRMNFGIVFQEGFPFGALLLDSHLRIIWSNHEFRHTWGVSKERLEEKSMTWDALCQLTNLGDTDPVLDALQNSLSGIYQIQVKPLNSSERSAPFEMYVNPLECAGQKRILVFFYPLSFLEQTIADQSKSIVTPIQKSLDEMIARNFAPEGVDKAQDEFFTAGIDHLFDRFQALDESLRIERKGYMQEMERLEDEVEFCHKAFSDIRKWSVQVRQTREDYCRRLVDLKCGVVTLSENVRTQYLNGESLITHGQDIVEGHCGLLGIGRGFYENIQRSQKAIGGLGKLRDVFKKMNGSIEEFRYKLYQSLDQVLIFSRTGKTEGDKIEQGILRLKGDVKSFDAIFEQLLRSIRTLDIVLSKVGMIIEEDKLNSNISLLEGGANRFGTVRKEFDALVSNSKNIAIKMGGYEEKVVQDLKRMYDSLITMGHAQKNLEEILKSSSPKRSQVRRVAAAPRFSL